MSLCVAFQMAAKSVNPTATSGCFELGDRSSVPPRKRRDSRGQRDLLCSWAQVLNLSVVCRVFVAAMFLRFIEYGGVRRALSPGR